MPLWRLTCPRADGPRGEALLEKLDRPSPREEQALSRRPLLDARRPSAPRAASASTTGRKACRLAERRSAFFSAFFAEGWRLAVPSDKRKVKAQVGVRGRHACTKSGVKRERCGERPVRSGGEAAEGARGVPEGPEGEQAQGLDGGDLALDRAANPVPPSRQALFVGRCWYIFTGAVSILVHILWERNRKHCYGEMGRHTGLRGLGPAGRLGSNPSSNNFLHILFPKQFSTPSAFALGEGRYFRIFGGRLEACRPMEGHRP